MSRPGVRRFVRRAALGLLIVVLMLAGCAAYLVRDPTPHFVARRSSLASAVESAATVKDAFATTPVRVNATSGLVVELAVRRAIADSGRRLPLAVILGGHRTGRDAVHLVGDTRGVVVAALSYPFTGHHRPTATQFLREIPKVRAALLDTPPAVMIALDYLLARPDVDTLNVNAVGVSLGAPFTTIAAALDRRISRVWIIHGSGGSYDPLETNLRRSIHSAPLRAAAAGVANVLIAGPRLDPVRWAPRIAPRPFIMVNAANDTQLPRASVEALHASAGEPKELIWMDGDHVRPTEATVQQLVAIVVQRMRAPAPLK